MTKEQLNSYIPQKRELTLLRQRLNGLKRSPDTDQEALQPLLEYYEAKQAELVAAQLEIERVIASLGSTERELFRLRYIEGLSWTQVSMRLNYNKQHVQRLHKKALERIKDR